MIFKSSYISNQLSVRLLFVSACFILLNTCSGGGGGSSLTPQEFCDSLVGNVYSTAEGDATVDATQLVAATADNPEYCNVQGTMPPSLGFEIKLPTDWNERLLAIGGGGFDGAIPQPAGYLLNENYVTVASDGGHTANGVDENWALDDEKLNDYAYRASHKVLLVAKKLIKKRYKQNALFSYYEGCSNGGREALIQAQRYPEDYNGIIARAPAFNFTWMMMAGNQNYQQIFSSAATQLSTAKIATLSDAVLDACDDLDNVADGIISNYAACSFDPSTLLCPGADADTCLTQDQIDTVNKLSGIYRLQDSTPYYIGWPSGGESDPLGWVYWIMDVNEGHSEYSKRFIQYFLQLGESYDPMDFVPDDNLPMILNRSALIDASSTDYSEFRALGNKLILWHGTNDWAISFFSTANYYNEIVAAAGGQANADEFVEFFPAPGVQHCFGGAGPDFVDLVSPLREWTENGTAPSAQDLFLLKFNFDTLSIENSRPLCKYPEYPEYNGVGDVTLFTSYSCVE